MRRAFLVVLLVLGAAGGALAQVAPDTWSTTGQLASTPAGVALDGDLAYPGSGDFLYMTTIGGEHTAGFFRYSLVTDSWGSLLAHPDGQAFHLGTALESAGGDLLYNFIGEFDSFWTYSTGGDTWTQLGNAPAAVFGGADLVYPRSGDFLYALSGSTDFFRYQISTNTWINTIADAPFAQNNGGSLVAPGGDFVYAFFGNNTTDFYRYSISGDAWTAMTAAPFGVSNGGDLVYPGSGDFIYALRGGSNTDFWRYSISADTWTVMAPVPAACFSGSTLVYPGTGSFIYAIQGAGGDVYRYRFTANMAPDPAAAVLLALQADGVTTISVGGDAPPGTSVVLRVTLDEPERGLWTVQIEVQPVGTAFTGTPTATGASTASGSPADVTISGLPDGPYHWQYRFIDDLGATSAYTSFGGNAESEADFTVGAAAAAAAAASSSGGRPSDTEFEKCFSFLAADKGSAGAPWILLAAVLLAVAFPLRRRRVPPA